MPALHDLWTVRLMEHRLRVVVPTDRTLEIRWIIFFNQLGNLSTLQPASNIIESNSMVYRPFCPESVLTIKKPIYTHPALIPFYCRQSTIDSHPPTDFTNHLHTRVNIQWPINPSTRTHILGMWEVTGATRGNPCITKNMKIPPQHGLWSGLNPGSLGL